MYCNKELVKGFLGQPQLPKRPNQFKLQTYDAVIRSKLVYGLESVERTSGQISHLNTLQSKGLRRSLNMKTVFVGRQNTNKKVSEAANAIKNP